jgi:hypothetical protein
VTLEQSLLSQHSHIKISCAGVKDRKEAVYRATGAGIEAKWTLVPSEPLRTTPGPQRLVETWEVCGVSLTLHMGNWKDKGQPWLLICELWAVSI